MDFISDLRPIDLFVVLCLAAGVFMGFTQGIIRTLLNCVVVLIAFVVASILRDPTNGTRPGTDERSVGNLRYDVDGRP